MVTDIKIFLSIYENKMDDRKRASVPSQFRNVIEKTGSTTIYAYPSLINQCIEVCTSERIVELEKHIEAFDIFSEEKDILATSILSACEAVQIDAKGRVYFSDRLLEFAHIDKTMVFVGKGKVFEIWNNENFNEHFNKARSTIKRTNLLQRREGSEVQR